MEIPKKRNYWIKDILLESKALLSALLLLVIFFFGIVSLYSIGYFITSNKPRIYKGKVVDKWISVFETQQGSNISGNILIEDENGKRLTIQVTKQMFDKINIGNDVQNQGNGIEIFSDNNSSHSYIRNL